MRTWGITAAAALIATVALTGCGGGSSSSSAAAPPTHAPATATTAKVTPAANPVDILRKIDGCHLKAGETMGDHDVYGDRYASCDYRDNDGTNGTNVTVYTWTSTQDAATTSRNKNNLKPDDSHKVINGKQFIVEITGDWSSYSKHVDADKIAAAVGGTIQD